MKLREKVVVCCAHSDDYVIGAGGTITKYVLEKKKVTIIIFSYGELSHPWLKSKVIQKIRVEEAEQASKLLGCKTIFFDLGDQKIYHDYKEKGIEKELLKILNMIKPNKIFTHSQEDPHIDHRSVHNITMEIYDKLNFKPEMYTYSVWNPVSIKTDYPTLFVDISKTFKTKLRALKVFHSQRYQAIYPLMLVILYRAVKNGLKIHQRFAESFYRVK